MQALESKKRYFDNYWREQPTDIADPRALERAAVAEWLLRHREGRLLDIGCGRGLVLEYFAYRGYDAVGADISPEAVESLDSRGFDCRLYDIESDYISEKFEIILCLEVLQQLYDPKAALETMRAALAEGGELVVSVPNEFHLVSRLRILFGITHLGHFEHSHIRLFTPRRAREIFDKAGLKVMRKADISIAPPRWKWLAALCRPLAMLMPSLFSLSTVYVLEAR